MSEIKPALTGEDWAYVLRGPGDDNEPTPRSPGEDWDGHHEAAALALHGQPFGFRHEDVDLLRSAVQQADRYAAAGRALLFTPAERARVLALADRIAALLPPR